MNIERVITVKILISLPDYDESNVPPHKRWTPWLRRIVSEAEYRDFQELDHIITGLDPSWEPRKDREGELPISCFPNLAFSC